MTVLSSRRAAGLLMQRDVFVRPGAAAGASRTLVVSVSKLAATGSQCEGSFSSSVTWGQINPITVLP